MVTCDLILLALAGRQVLVERVVSAADIGQASLDCVNGLLSLNKHIGNEQVGFIAGTAADVLNVPVGQLGVIGGVDEQDVASGVFRVTQRDSDAFKARHRFRGENLIFRSPYGYGAARVRLEVDLFRQIDLRSRSGNRHVFAKQ